MGLWKLWSVDVGTRIVTFGLRPDTMVEDVKFHGVFITRSGIYPLNLFVKKISSVLLAQRGLTLNLHKGLCSYGFLFYSSWESYGIEVFPGQW